MGHSWSWFVLGVICAIIALALGRQLWIICGFFAWIWMLPAAIFVAMAVVQFVDVGLHGAQPPR